MIEMPGRSVTRFFIPLIDVLLLLFCIFLLMPVFGEEEGSEGDSKARLSAEDLADSYESLKRELLRKTQDLQRIEKLQASLVKMDIIMQELERLRKEKQQALLRPTYVRVLDVDGKTGDLSFFDPTNLDNPVLPIPNEKSARALIVRHKKEAGDRQLYYHFLYPRHETGRPTLAQEMAYKRWFAGVAQSLQEKAP